MTMADTVQSALPPVETLYNLKVMPVEPLNGEPAEDSVP